MTYTFPNTVIFSTPGSTTWAPPAGVRAIQLVMIGGGGGGGGGGAGGSSANAAGGGGGASGGYGASGELIKFANVPVIPGATYNIQVGGFGAGGSAGVSNGPGGYGNSGNPSVFRYPGGQTYTANGGLGGVSGTAGNQAFISNPGASSSVTVNYNYNMDGSQGGLAGGTPTGGSNPSSHVNPATLPSANGFSIYSIFTDYDLTPLSSASYALGPFVNNFSQTINGVKTNQAIDVSLSQMAYANQQAGSSFTSAGGAGGVLAVTNPIPLYMIGVDISTLSSSGIIFPSIESSFGGQLGTGNVGNVGGTPNSSYVIQWNNTATVFGFGAGGLGGPGGGGGGNFNFGSNTNYAAGNGFQGDRGLSGMVMISWK